jgi:CheY-like chemotaxis protein
MKVLIIDDEEDVRSVANLSLADVGGMEVFEASNGAEGVRCARDVQPDVILLDMMMPGMDGVATLGWLRDDAMTAAIPVIFLTAKAMTSEVRQLQERGALGVITKPFDPMTLADQVRTMLMSLR